ncbi:zinc finger, PMZ-type containing protein [Tanacetum coccineum]
MDDMKQINIEDHAHWTVFPCACQALEVRCGNQAFGVNLAERRCARRLWKLSGVPCIHAVAGYMHLNRDPDEGESLVFTRDVVHGISILN